MSAKTVLLISGPKDYVGRLGIESVGLNLCEATSQRGGVGWAGWLESGILKVRIHGLPLDEIRMLLNANFASAVENAQSLWLNSKSIRHRCRMPWPERFLGTP